jgi:hypothetical protein
METGTNGIGGYKRFWNSPDVPLPTTASNAASKAYVDNSTNANTLAEVLAAGSIASNAVSIELAGSIGSVGRTYRSSYNDASDVAFGEWSMNGMFLYGLTVARSNSTTGAVTGYLWDSVNLSNAAQLAGVATNDLRAVWLGNLSVSNAFLVTNTGPISIGSSNSPNGNSGASLKMFSATGTVLTGSGGSLTLSAGTTTQGFGAARLILNGGTSSASVSGGGGGTLAAGNANPNANFNRSGGNINISGGLAGSNNINVGGFISVGGASGAVGGGFSMSAGPTFWNLTGTVVAGATVQLIGGNTNGTAGVGTITATSISFVGNIQHGISNAIFGTDASGTNFIFVLGTVTQKVTLGAYP